jgi:hypothetical protein
VIASSIATFPLILSAFAMNCKEVVRRCGEARSWPLFWPKVMWGSQFMWRSADLKRLRQIAFLFTVNKKDIRRSDSRNPRGTKTRRNTMPWTVTQHLQTLLSPRPGDGVISKALYCKAKWEAQTRKLLAARLFSTFFGIPATGTS